MFRQMRRFKQQLSQEECEQVHCSPSVAGSSRFTARTATRMASPWITCMSRGGFTSTAPRKVTSSTPIKADNRVSFTVVDQGVQVEGKQGPDVRSVIVFGRVTLMETTSEALEIACRLGEKYDPADFVADELVRTEKRLQMLELVVDHMTGKRVNES